MTPPTARHTPQALPARTLTILTALVLLAHALLLASAPLQWGPVPDAHAAPPRPFITRTLVIPPAAPAAKVAVPAPVRSPAVRKTVRRVSPAPPPLQENQPPTADPLAQAAKESITSAATDPALDTSDSSPAPAAPAAASDPVLPGPAPEPPAPAGATAALAIPGSVRLKYAMTGRSKNLDYSAFAELDWLQDGQTYDAKMVISALFLGSRSMTSSGRITADGLAPTRFLDKSRSERAAHFQADKGKITFSANSPDVPWLRGAQDRLSVFLQLGSLLAGDPASYPPGSSVSLYTTGPTSADTWTFAVGAEEKLVLPAGEMTALKLTRKPQRDYDQSVEIWFAPAMGYLPVRSRITQQNGDFIDQQLRGVEKP